MRTNLSYPFQNNFYYRIYTNMTIIKRKPQIHIYMIYTTGLISKRKKRFVIVCYILEKMVF